MALILNIDTSTYTGSVAISRENETIISRKLKESQNVSSHLTGLIEQILHEGNFQIKQLDAIALNIGPGSYTSLRTGMSVAKGMAYALEIPIIGLTAFEILLKQAENASEDIIMAMIEARRMDVYAQIWKKNENILSEPEFLSLDNSFFELYKGQNILCLGDGAMKVASSPEKPKNWKVEEIAQSAHIMATLASEKYIEKQFIDTAYSVPYYFKEPNITQPKHIFIKNT